MSVVIDGTAPHEIAYAAGILRSGGLVAFPTETVYGLGADARDERAVARIFAAKGRPANHPLIVHLGDADHMDRWARDIPAAAWQVAERFWPGPLTLILNRAEGVADAVTGGQDTIGLRMPDHPVAGALLNAFGSGIAAPSANRFGRVSPTTAAHVMAELGDAVDCVVDGGPCSVGLESTILDLSGPRPRVLRPGAVTRDALAEMLGGVPSAGGSDSPRVPGALPVHYAPETPLRLLDAAAIEPAARALVLSGRAFTVLSMRLPAFEASNCRWRTMPSDPRGYARVLYAYLRDADAAKRHCILIEQPPATADWEAVRDRLGRAAAGAQADRPGEVPGDAL